MTKMIISLSLSELKFGLDLSPEQNGWGSFGQRHVWNKKERDDETRPGEIKTNNDSLCVKFHVYALTNSNLDIGACK